MIILFKIVFITSILVLGWKIVTNEGMGLYGISVWANNKIQKGNKLFELMVCPFCMPSIFSVFGYAFSIICGITPLSMKIFFMYPLVVCGASIVSGVSWILFTLLTKKIEYYEGLDMSNFKDDPNDEREVDDEPNEMYFKRN